MSLICLSRDKRESEYGYGSVRSSSSGRKKWSLRGRKRSDLDYYRRQSLYHSIDTDSYDIDGSRSLPTRLKQKKHQRPSLAAVDPNLRASTESMIAKPKTRLDAYIPEPIPPEKGFSHEYMSRLFSSINKDYESISQKYRSDDRVSNPRLRSYHNVKHAPSFNRMFAGVASQETLDKPPSSRSQSRENSETSTPISHVDESLDRQSPEKVLLASPNSGTLYIPKNSSIGSGARIVSPLPPAKQSKLVQTTLDKSSIRYGDQFRLRNCTAMVAINFGAKYCDFAYISATNPDEIRNGRGETYSRQVRSCLLLESDGKFHSFGDAAYDFYVELNSDIAESYQFFEELKESLFEKVPRTNKVRASNGQLMSVTDLFTHVLRYFKMLVLTTLEAECGIRNPGMNGIQWVFGVPGTWTQASLRVFRLAALRAGMIPPGSPELLQLMPEIDCAAIYTVQHLDKFRRLQEDVATVLRLQLRQGDRFLLVDCGSSKIEGAVYELQQYGISEVVPRIALASGSNLILRKFENQVSRALGVELFEGFKTVNHPAYLRLMSSFEERICESKGKIGPLFVPTPFGLLDFYRREVGHSLECALKGNTGGIDWSTQGDLRVSPSTIQRLHEPSIGRVLYVMNRLLTAASTKRLKGIFLTGGLAQSTYLQQTIVGVYGKEYCIYNLPSSSYIAEGCSLLGLHQSYITSRISTCTVGVGILQPFNSRLHPSYKRVSRNGRYWCADVFDPLLTAGESVSHSRQVPRFYAPTSSKQVSIKVQLYVTEKQNVHFVTENDVRPLGLLTVRLPMDSSQKDEVKVIFYPGSPELKAEAELVSNGQKLDVSIDFLAPPISTVL